MRGLGEGRYAKATPILDRAGVPLAHHPEQLQQFNALPKSKQNDDDAIQLRVASFGSWPASVDWDADGDADMVIGAFDGQMFLRTNVGTAKQPEWAPESVRIEAGQKPLAVNQHAAPAAADWDSDGLFDLVVGAADGSVVWFKNEGAKGKPAFTAARPLVPARASDKFVQYHVAPGELPPPGVRAQVAVVDYDLDDKLDLLVGDYAGVTQLRELTAAERAEFEALREQSRKLSERLQDAPDQPTRAALTAEFEALAAKLKTFEATQNKARTARSYVWLYRRTD